MAHSILFFNIILRVATNFSVLVWKHFFFVNTKIYKALLFLVYVNASMNILHFEADWWLHFP